MKDSDRSCKIVGILYWIVCITFLISVLALAVDHYYQYLPPTAFLILFFLVVASMVGFIILIKASEAVSEFRILKEDSRRLFGIHDDDET